MILLSIKTFKVNQITYNYCQTAAGSTPTKSVSLARHVQCYSRSSRAVWFKYSNLDASSPNLLSQLMKIKVFADAIQK